MLLCVRTMYKIEQTQCIECEFCSKICPKKAVAEAKIAFEITDKCAGCGLCAKRCPVKAIQKKE